MKAIKYCELKEVVKYLEKFKTINSIYRIDYNTLLIEFDRANFIYFNMERGKSFIYQNENQTIRPQKILAPFDNILSQRFHRSIITSLKIINQDKILRIDVQVKKSYKIISSSIQFEFTGKHTNIILLDENLIILEALHHITEFQSTRFVKVGEKLSLPPKPKFQFQDCQVSNVREFLISNYQEFNIQKLTQIKKNSLKHIDKKIEKLKQRISQIENSEILLNLSKKYQKIGELIFININNIPNFQDKINLTDFDGSLISFDRPKEAKTVAEMGNIFFQKAKKLKQKSENISIELKSLNNKIEFLEKLKSAIENSSTVDEVKILTNKNPDKKKSKSQETSSVATFWIENHKILLGKNEKGNIEVLNLAKSSDIWVHLKDRPSAHVIIVTDRREVKQNIIYEAGKLCLKFSVTEKGKYLVDWTKRRNVRIQKGANVLYTKYNTITLFLNHF